MSKQIKKILLIFPPVTCARECSKLAVAPLGLMYLAAFFRPHYEVKILDAVIEGFNNDRFLSDGFYEYGLSDQEIANHIQEFAPDFVGVSCLFSSQFPSVIRICNSAKTIAPEIITVIGGTHPTFLPEECLKSKSIDFIVRGEGEYVMKELLDCLASRTALDNVKGIAFRKNDEILVNEAAPLIADLDSLPFPAWDMMPLDLYEKINLPMGLVQKQKPTMNITTSRGCPFQCMFCSSCHFWLRKYRARSVANVLLEMEQLKSRGIRELKFFDDNLTLDKERAKKIFQGMIDRKFGFTWNTPNGIAAQTLDEEIVFLMKKSGCYEITLAIESGDESVLKNVLKKPIDLNQTIKIAQQIKALGINTYGFFIIGFPQETKQQIYNTLEFIEKIKLDRISLFIANPLPGTEIFDVCQKNGYLKGDNANRKLDYFNASFETPEFSSQWLEDLRRKWYWKYNIKLLLRNPFKFFSIYSIFIFKRPRMMLKIVLNKVILPSLESFKNAKRK